jgi:hypothetical protein
MNTNRIYLSIARMGGELNGFDFFSGTVTEQ